MNVMRPFDSSRTSEGFRHRRANPLCPFLLWNCLDLHSCSRRVPFAHPIFAALAINGTNYAVCLWSSLLSFRMLFVWRCNGTQHKPIHYTVVCSLSVSLRFSAFNLIWNRKMFLRARLCEWSSFACQFSFTRWPRCTLFISTFSFFWRFVNRNLEQSTIKTDTKKPLKLHVCN